MLPCPGHGECGNGRAKAGETKPPLSSCNSSYLSDSFLPNVPQSNGGFGGMRVIYFIESSGETGWIYHVLPHACRHLSLTSSEVGRRAMLLSFEETEVKRSHKSPKTSQWASTEAETQTFWFPVLSPSTQKKASQTGLQHLGKTFWTLDQPCPWWLLVSRSQMEPWYWHFLKTTPGGFYDWVRLRDAD